MRDEDDPVEPEPFGEFRLVERLAVGGMAEVYLAGHSSPDRLVAVKRILPNVAEDEEFIAMFVDEAKIAGQLAHANIAQIFDIGKVGESYFIAMEYISGVDLRAMWDRTRDAAPDGRSALPLPLICYIIQQMCAALDYAHRRRDQKGRPLGIIHRDVSPQNVLVSYAGDVKLIDFGIAKAANRLVRTQTGILKGKFAYMAPEQASGEPTDHRADIFAIGVTAYELLTGTRAFSADTDFALLEKVRRVAIAPMRELAPQVPQALERIVLRAMARDPAARYPWASALADDIERFMREARMTAGSAELSQFVQRVFREEHQLEQRRLASYRRVLGRAPPSGDANFAATLLRSPGASAPPAPHDNDATLEQRRLLDVASAGAAPARGAHPRSARVALADPVDERSISAAMRAQSPGAQSGTATVTASVAIGSGASGARGAGRASVHDHEDPTEVDGSAVGYGDVGGMAQSAGPPPLPPDPLALSSPSGSVRTRTPPRVPVAERSSSGRNVSRQPRVLRRSRSLLRWRPLPLVAAALGFAVGLAVMAVGRSGGGASAGAVLLTTPRAVEVWANGKNLCAKTPCTLPFHSGAHTLEFRRAGSAPLVREVTLSQSNAGEGPEIIELQLDDALTPRLETSPPGANVTLDGAVVPGTTPLTLPPVRVGRVVRLKLTRENTAPLEVVQTVDARDPVWRFDLPSATTTWTLALDPPDAAVDGPGQRRDGKWVIGGVRRATTIRVARPGCEAGEATVMPTGRPEAERTVQLVCRMRAGGVVISAPRRSVIRINGIEVPRDAPLNPYRLPAGTWTVVVKSPRGKSVTRTLDLKDHETLVFDTRLR